MWYRMEHTSPSKTTVKFTYAALVSIIDIYFLDNRKLNSPRKITEKKMDVTLLASFAVLIIALIIGITVFSNQKSGMFLCKIFFVLLLEYPL